MKALEVKTIEKDVTVTYNFFRVQNEKELATVVVFENGYTERLDYISSLLSFGSFKEEKSFKSTMSNTKRLEVINSNIDRIASNYPSNFFN